MNSKMLGSRVKGFTLIEMLIVIAIIGILAGMTSLAIQGFQRDARIETNNTKAQMMHSGWQNQLIKCEINQDRSLLDAGGNNLDASGNSAPLTTDADTLEYVELYFRIKEGQVGNQICVASSYEEASGAGSKIIIVPTDGGIYDKWYEQLKEAILSFVDNTFDGAFAVYIDYENYTVDSVMLIESTYFDGVDLTQYTTSIGPYFAQFNTYADPAALDETDKVCRLLNNPSKQKEFIKYKGIYFGAYPTLASY